MALSEDGAALAVAGVHREVWVFDVARGRRAHTLPCAATVGEGDALALAAVPAPGGGFGGDRAYALAVGGQDKAATIWELSLGGHGDGAGCGGHGGGCGHGGGGGGGGARRVLKLARPRDVHAVALSAQSVAVAAGAKVVVVGGAGPRQFGWRDRPDFEAMADLLEGDPEVRLLNKGPWRTCSRATPR